MRTREVVAALVPRRRPAQQLECTPWWWLPLHTYLVLLYVFVFIMLTAVGIDGWMSLAVIGVAAATASQTVRSAATLPLRSASAVKQLVSGRPVLWHGRWARA